MACMTFGGAQRIRASFCVAQPSLESEGHHGPFFSTKGNAMSKTTLVRYKTHPQHAAENAALIARVFAALARDKPAGVRYQVLCAEDGVSFTHVVTLEDGLAVHPLTSLPEFKAFVADIATRCETAPQQVPSTVLGRYPG